MKKIIRTDAAPAAIGPYSQAVVANGFVFVSGQIPIDPATNQLIEGDVAAQTHRVMQNLQALLVNEAGKPANAEARIHAASLPRLPR